MFDGFQLGGMGRVRQERELPTTPRQLLLERNSAHWFIIANERFQKQRIEICRRKNEIFQIVHVRFHYRLFGLLQRQKCEFRFRFFKIENISICNYFFRLWFQANVVLEGWNIKDIRWYIGHESKRNPQSEWSITFIRHKKKTSRYQFVQKIY